MTELIYFFILMCLFVCLVDIKSGVLITILIGFLQDPIRKLVPGEPVYLSALVGLFIASTFLGAQLQRKLIPFSAIAGWNELLRLPAILFSLWVILECIATYMYTGSFVLVGIGLLVYLSIFPAVQLSHSFALYFDRILSFISFYVAVCGVMVLGVYLSYFGFDWRVLESVGETMVVYSATTGDPIELPSGFFRQPEIAAWHAGAGACFCLLLGICVRGMATKLIYGALAILFFGGVLLTGRRKFLVEIIIFLPLLLVFAWHFRLAIGRIVYAVLGVAFLLLVILLVLNPELLFSIQDASTRGIERQGETFDRLYGLTIGSFYYILLENGILGAGAGLGSGGAQYFAGEGVGVGFAAEGGFGKVLAELGIPGLIILMWLIFQTQALIRRLLGILSKSELELSLVAIGLAAFLVTNVFVFMGAHQVYSDPFILWLHGSFLGFIFALGNICYKKLLNDDITTQQRRLSMAIH